MYIYPNSFPIGVLEETTGMPLYYMDEDYPAGPEINEPLTERSMASLDGSTYSSVSQPFP